MPALTSGIIPLATDTAGDQFDTAVASGGGVSVTVWTHRAGDSNRDVRAQMFNADGSRRGGEIVVANSPRSETQPAVAVDDAGNWKVAWGDLVSADSSNFNIDIWVGSFSRTGTRRRADQRVADSTRVEFLPSIAVDAVGGYVLAYTFWASPTDTDVYAVKYADDGTFQRLIEVDVGAGRTGRPSVARSKGAVGRFAIAYEVGFDVPANGSAGIALQRFTGDGGRLSTQLLTAADPGDRQSFPRVAVDDFNRIVVVWERFSTSNDTGLDIFARRVSSTGVMGATLTIAGTPEIEVTPVVAMDPADADFVVVWESGNRVAFREMNANGTPKGAIGVLADSGGDNRPAVACDMNGDYFVTFTSFGRAGEPGSGVFGRRGRLS